MREKQTGYLGIEETLSTISTTMRTLIPKMKKRAQWGPREKTFRKETHSVRAII
jgi:hypothetical protein